MTVMSVWVAWTPIREDLIRRQFVEVASTGTPYRAGAEIVDDFAEDLRKLAET